MNNNIIYQIYPLSFKDGNGDGYGDLAGIISRLDYLQDLGVTGIWLSPIYASPMKDFGYDVADYCRVDPLFGDLEKFDQLIKEARQRNLKVLLDYIPNHTSDQHPWFREAKSSKNNHKRDWYIWADPASDSKPPNNWMSVFGGSSWEYDKGTQQYYFHQFLKEQPDLNWRNPKVQQAMLNVLEFWLKRGVDGFRIDALFFLFEDKKLRNDPQNKRFHGKKNEPFHALRRVYDYNQPEVFSFVDRVFALVQKYPSKLLISEIPGDITSFAKLYRQTNSCVHLPFNFSLINLPWKANDYQQTVSRYLNSLKERKLANFVLGNHDCSRVASRIGAEKARLLAMLELTLPGMAFIYYGDEIGMENVSIPRKHRRDLYGIRVHPRFGRDGERTPMQWDDSANAGFSTGKPWLPIAANYEITNVKNEQKSKTSILSLYQTLIRLKKNHPALSGSFRFLENKNPALIAFERTGKTGRLIIILNYSQKSERFTSSLGKGTLICDTALAKQKIPLDLTSLALPPLAGYLIEQS